MLYLVLTTENGADNYTFSNTNWKIEFSKLIAKTGAELTVNFMEDNRYDLTSFVTHLVCQMAGSQ